MRALLWLLPLLLSACVVGVRPEPAPPPPVRSSSGFVLNARLGLPPYPDSVALKREERGGSSEAEFETRDPLEQVYAFFHNWLTNRGWVRTRLEYKGPASKLEAEYRRGAERFKLELDRQGQSGRYKLEIDF
ncbi:hypothetical protein [Meiothermus taiwanensis]|jgi:hypothetical protein|uniref:Lipoprotein n=1 Tax=Meiothermus taiwanensis WR-220 TaxID=1339250 RepID=A0ABM6WG66_9DEIN|nr:hypothetical protein [Meiothermus taiwanensis]AWR85856.1 hypothetical protein Mtai_v1c06090 [Meiothermus taiwanensis WR-220]KIQ55413.1 hypothetical protein SY28_03740 [Meiothermus taiwanensis]KZK16614.1 hypothetical protein A3962_05440 [Meiothermus taiwanensis]